METYIPRFFNPGRQSHFIFGPRSTGKSTFLKKTYPEALYIDLLKPDIFRRLSARPELLAEMVLGNPEKKIIIIDEIQKLPDILSIVHKLIEDHPSVKFILTGSSARKLKRKGVDLLAGRLSVKSFHPFIFSELPDEFHLDKALFQGMLPVVYNSPDPADTLEAYVSLYIKEEVQHEGLTRNIGNFNRFLESISFSHASLLNITNVSRDCEVERKVVEGYIQILEDILLAWRLPVFTKKAKRVLVKRSKFYLFDAGVYRTLRPKGPLDNPQEIDGAALEGLVGQHLLAYKSARRDCNLYFWRSRGGLEVDFILYGPSLFFAIEVKNSAKIRPVDLRPLNAFKQDYPQCSPILLYRGKDRLLKSGIHCIPVEEFLKTIHPEKVISIQSTAR